MPCRVIQVMRDLLLHLVILRGESHPIAAAQAPQSNENVIERSAALVTETQQNIPHKGLDSCLSVLLSSLQKTDLLLVDAAIINRMSSLLAFDYAEIAARVRSVSDAQKLIDLIDLPLRSRCSMQGCLPGIGNFCKGTSSSAVPLFQRTSP
ncbi:hypothetical protein M378DRAFT_523810 [Amanita muscaria Koide BX008]|uniref:Uncharacterized protein n=1 Tax=Amanita muscaria (strain Koide BX008) TaxID=946122 RepID=A0A0C2SQW5_AMAMK|nr:hypothetical protein M378DRAFT_523810 [Amanita muscaria Koide BX008]